MLKIHCLADCQHLKHRSPNRGGYLDKLERVTCKTCLKNVLAYSNEENYRKKVSVRLLEVRFLNREPAIMRIVERLKNG